MNVTDYRVRNAEIAQEPTGRRSYSTLLRLAIETSILSIEQEWKRTGDELVLPRGDTVKLQPPNEWVTRAVARAGEGRARILTEDFGVRSFLLADEDTLDVLDYQLADFDNRDKPGHELEATPARKPSHPYHPYLLPTHRRACAASSPS